IQEKLAAGDITNFGVDANKVVGVAAQPDRRIVYFAMRDPIGPFVPRSLTVGNVADRKGQTMPQQTLPIETTVVEPAGVVSGRVIQADGTPVPFANIRLIYWVQCEDEVVPVGISSKSTDENGRYSWDYVLKNGGNLVRVQIAAVDPITEQPRIINFNVARDGQRLNVDLVFLGRGTVKGRVLANDGVTPIKDAVVTGTSFVDQSSYGAVTDANGAYTLLEVPVGNVLLQAVSVATQSQTTASENVPFAGATATRDLVLFPVNSPTVKKGTITGHVLRSDGVAVVPNAPVVLYYKNGSQPGVTCGPPDIKECPLAISETDAIGAYTFADIVAGSHRIYAFDQPTLEEGDSISSVGENGTASVTILLSGGVATVTGAVLTADGTPVPGALVGGGFTIGTTNQNGEFVLTDVPVGHRVITAVSEALHTSGSTTVDIGNGDSSVRAVIVLDSTATVTGNVVEADGGTPVVGNKVYLFKFLPTCDGCDPKIAVLGTTTTDAAGAYRIEKVRVNDCRPQACRVSAFRSDFSDGNTKDFGLRFSGQSIKVDLRFQGGGNGHVTGVVYDDDGVTPLPAKVAISGLQVTVAGGLVGIGLTQVQYFKVVDTDFTTGRYDFSGVWAGRFTISAVGAFSPDPVSVASVMPPGGQTVEVNLRLQPTGKITGTVFEPDGVTPVGAGVLVKFRSEEFKTICSENAVGDVKCVRIPQGIQDETVPTNPDGTYELPLVNAGDYSITVEDPASGLVGQVKGTLKAGDDGDIDVRLLNQSDVTIRVIGSDGSTPIPGARVEVTQSGFAAKPMTVTADAQGVAQLAGGNGLNEGEFAILATDTRNGFAGRASGKVRADSAGVNVSVFLYNASGTVSGTVFAPDGLTPVPNAEVVISNLDGPLTFAVTDAQGRYLQDLIPLGDFAIDVFEAASGRRGFATGRIDLNHQEVPVNIVELGMGLVRGRVLAGGDLDPLPGWRVTAAQRSPSGRTLETLLTTSGLAGEYSFPGVSVGTFALSATPPTGAGSATASGELTRDGQVVELPLVAIIPKVLYGTVTGRVFNPDGTPSANAEVTIGDGLLAVLRTADAEGRFTAPNYPVSRFIVTARSQTSQNVGSTVGELFFNGDTVDVSITMVGLSSINGIVVDQDGVPAPNVQLTLEGSPASGCGVRCDPNEDECPASGFKETPCSTGSDLSGLFSFSNIPARTFTIVATDPVSDLKGSVGGTLNAGVNVVRIVLEASGALTGRALLGGLPAAGIVAEVQFAPREPGQADISLFTTTRDDGVFGFSAVPVGSYTLLLQDPIGEGSAKRFGQLTGDVALGDIALDAAPPAVSEIEPANGAIQVPRSVAITLTFSEAIDPGTVTAQNVVLTGPTGPVTALLNVSGGDRVVTVTPLAILKDQTNYSLRVQNIVDRLGKPLLNAFVSSFTTVDIMPPVITDVAPIPSANGVAIYTTVRVKYSEPILPSAFRGPPIVLTKDGVAVAGRTDYLFGNTVVVFTPNLPLKEDGAYAVVGELATDLAGLTQIAPLSFSFTTTDRTPPVVQGLVPANNGNVITNSTTTVTADVGATHDVDLVDFFINGVFAFTDRSAPFAVTLQAVPALGAVGDRIKVSALATDTSGNRS
ncbi:MAG: Ig-like domain-containing protein, partial [Vicinamibacterales bacterium]